jgi:hypothetical protein
MKVTIDLDDDVAAALSAISGRLTADSLSIPLREPIDDFADAANRLCGGGLNDDDDDVIDRLLIALARRGVISDSERFTLHAAHTLSRRKRRRIQSESTI